MPIKTKNNSLQKDMHIATAMQCVVAACLEQLKAQVPGIVENGDSECIHQARVALRRLRSANNAFHNVCKHKSWLLMLQEARWLATQLGEVRDLQLLQSKILPTIKKANSELFDAQPLHVVVENRLTIAIERLRKALRSQRYVRFIHSVQRWLYIDISSKGDLRKFSAKSLQKNWRRARKLAKQWEKLDAIERHTLRKQFKKLRYSIEFFAPLFSSKRVKKYLQKLQEIQQLLGDLNDAVSAQHLLLPFLKQSSRRSAANLALGWLSCSEQQQLMHIEPVIKQWRDCKPFWQ